MFGFKLVKANPNMYFMQYRGGKVQRSGVGQSFVYFAPTSSIVAVPMSSENVPFIFNEVTADYQSLTVQGQVTYCIKDAARIAKRLNFTLAANNRDYVSDDPKKLSQWVLTQVQTRMRAQLQQLSLKEALVASDNLARLIREALTNNDIFIQFGLEILGLSVMAITPTPETARALEAEVRERILLQADEAVYQRRNAAVEQERAIKENELNTEIAVESKKRQIRETQIEADFAIQEKRQVMAQAKMQGSILLEEKRQKLVTIAAENATKESDAKAYEMNAVMAVFKTVDAKTMQALASIGMAPAQLIAAAFQNIAENADKIGNLNIAPELLQELLTQRHPTADRGRR